ncbi:glycosyltransferase family 32 protein [Parapedobacter sp. DT-150]|uniref:glycosyltransferase family 32 protein n=1 Tax=Parapedobacter sp. DT-150 TaxID=3396162 RepID=UPI003F1D0785
MIPKIIHYSWFSGEPIPTHIQELMATWKKFMPDYEYVLWDGKKLAEINNTFANEAVSVRKWAFASDFIRLYAVYHHGGIWFDTDIEVFKSFDSVLDNRMFIANEAGAKGHGNKYHWLTAHCFGAEKKHPFIKDCLDFYTERHFIRTTSKNFPPNFQFDLTISPEIMATVARNYGYDCDGFRDDEQLLKEGIHVYPSDYFDSPQYRSMKRVYSIHREAGGWRPGNEGKMPNYKGTNPKKGKLLHVLKTSSQKFLAKFHLAIIHVK